MRLGVAGTILSAKTALNERFFWNLSGGYHHASQHSIEGFCIYNDIGIAYQELLKSKHLSAEDHVLIIDTDAHHGNGNARTFMDNDHVTLIDVYNQDIYPTTPSTRQRVNIPVPLRSGVNGEDYLIYYKNALQKISRSYKIAFVVAGTDVISADTLGGINLSLDDIEQREIMTVNRLKELDIPTVILSGGAYSTQSARAIEHAILAVSKIL